MPRSLSPTLRRLLEPIVRDPGTWTAKKLAQAIDPPKLEPLMYREWLQRRRTHLRRTQRRLGTLQERGLIERQRPPRLSASFAEVVREIGPPLAVAELRGMYDEPVTTYNAVTIVERMLASRRHKEQASTSDLVGPGASGAMRRAYQWLCEQGAIDAPSLRWPTPAGIAAVETVA